MKRVLIAAVALTMITGIANAHDGGPGRGDEGVGGEAIVATDGIVFITRASATTSGATEVVAVRPTGTIAWTSTLTSGRGRLVLSDGNLISESSTKASDGTVSTTLTAISTVSGAASWTRTIAGRVGDLRPFSGGTYAVVVTPAATAGGTPARSLLAIGNDGSVLWTVSI